MAGNESEDRRGDGGELGIAPPGEMAGNGRQAREQAEARARARRAHAQRYRARLRDKAEARAEWCRVKGMVRAQGGWVWCEDVDDAHARRHKAKARAEVQAETRAQARRDEAEAQAEAQGEAEATEGSRVWLAGGCR